MATYNWGENGSGKRGGLKKKLIQIKILSYLWFSRDVHRTLRSGSQPSPWPDYTLTRADGCGIKVSVKVDVLLVVTGGGPKVLLTMSVTAIKATGSFWYQCKSTSNPIQAAFQISLGLELW